MELWNIILFVPIWMGKSALFSQFYIHYVRFMRGATGWCGKLDIVVITAAMYKHSPHFKMYSYIMQQKGHNETSR